MQQVKESLNEGYCDISGRAGDLDLIGQFCLLSFFGINSILGIMGEVKVFASRGKVNRCPSINDVT
jgi:hypothetical protein